MKHIEVTEITVPAGQETYAVGYPKDGFYFVNGGWLVLKASNVVYTMFTPSIAVHLRDSVEVKPAPQTMDLAAILAVALHRDAAVEYVK